MLKKQYILMAFILAFATASNVAAFLGGFFGHSKSTYELAYDQLKSDLSLSAGEFCKPYSEMWDSLRVTTGPVLLEASSKVQAGAKGLSNLFGGCFKESLQEVSENLSWLSATNVPQKRFFVAAGRILAVALPTAVIVMIVKKIAKQRIEARVNAKCNAQNDQNRHGCQADFQRH